MLRRIEVKVMRQAREELDIITANNTPEKWGTTGCKMMENVMDVIQPDVAGTIKERLADIEFGMMQLQNYKKIYEQALALLGDTEVANDGDRPSTDEELPGNIVVPESAFDEIPTMTMEELENFGSSKEDEEVPKFE